MNNHLVHFKLKMMIVLMFCAFMTFSMLVYFMKITEKCENFNGDETCLYINKNSVFKATYVLYNLRNKATALANQLARPSLSPVDQSSVNVYGLYTETTAKRKNFEYAVKITANLPGVVSSSSEATFDELNETFSFRREKKTAQDESFSSPVKGVSSQKAQSEEEIYENRRRNLQQLCPKYLNLTKMQKIMNIKLNHILIDERHKILYCYVPKVACTNWKRIFLVLTGKAKNISEAMNLPASRIHAKNLFKSLQNYSVADVVNVTEEYRKFIFVRHPFERLLSAYRNKLEQHYDSSKYFQARFGKYIIKNFRKNPTNVSLARGDDVTFAEFVRYIVSSKPEHYNEHWQRVTDLCHPCLIRYDFIGKYNSLAEDSNFLLRRLGADFDFPLVSKVSTTSSNLRKYYGTLERTAIYKLYKIYEMDFRLFGYDLSEILYKSSDPVR